jgi:hypothetical protein
MSDVPRVRSAIHFKCPSKARTKARELRLTSRRMFSSLPLTFEGIWSIPRVFSIAERLGQFGDRLPDLEQFPLQISRFLEVGVRELPAQMALAEAQE